MRRITALFALVAVLALASVGYAAVQVIEVAPGDHLDAHCETEFVHATVEAQHVHAECATPTPTPTPVVEEPVAGETCPAWVHDRYVTEGPDGHQYPTWHPQIDEQYGCYFHHEHGSDPRLFGDGSYQPAYGYVNAHGHAERHQGFKNIVWTNGGWDWLYVIHQGSVDQSRACTRFHAINVVVANDATNEVVADLHLFADFGEARINRTDAKIPLSSCEHIEIPGGYQVDSDGNISFPGTGERRIPSMDADNIGYEPWRIDTRPTLPVLGFHEGDISVNVASSVTACVTSACAEVVEVGDWVHRHGALRHVIYRVDDKEQFGVVDPHGRGTFTTDIFGTSFDGNVIQYIKPGLRAFAASGGRHYPADPVTMFYERYDQLPYSRGLLNHDMALGSPQ